ncbi:MAG: sigma factor [Thiolinea sp.]
MGRHESVYAENTVSDTHYRQLYERFCQGDARASRALVNELGQRLLHYVRRTCIYHDQQAAEDCVQKTWLKLLQYCGQPLRAGTSFWGLVCTIARHQVVMTIRQLRVGENGWNTGKNRIERS